MRAGLRCAAVFAAQLKPLIRFRFPMPDVTSYNSRVVYDTSALLQWSTGARPGHAHLMRAEHLRPAADRAIKTSACRGR